MVTGGCILAATDGTERSRAVLGRAQLIARHWGARLALVHVRKPSAARFRLRLARTAPDHLAQALVEHGGRAEDLHILDAAPAEGVIALARQLGAGLVVLGLHRERRVLDTLRMTTMERITLGVDCPVLVAQRYPVQPYARVLGALSFDPICGRGLAQAARIAPGAAFHAIHALPRAATDSATARARDLQRAEERRAAFMRCKDLPPDMPLPEIVPGGVHEVLRFRMEEWQPDLLVIGAHSGRDPTRLGNYARDLMRAPPTDALVTKPDLSAGLLPPDTPDPATTPPAGS
ncbi:universal stress protein [Roseibaca sp. Y0-43]|uniref:universal stress protein n=1 Tax=Roseibaca sp. Y0-43 TaxID=2816854 RepID=UPI001D0C2F57|nr:universal stress protein [Roseibaca sp. Y0-43]MCC1481501.1 universal stress protein [Roseibaca sp. Y0-43]